MAAQNGDNAASKELRVLVSRLKEQAAQADREHEDKIASLERRRTEALEQARHAEERSRALDHDNAVLRAEIARLTNAQDSMRAQVAAAEDTAARLARQVAEKALRSQPLVGSSRSTGTATTPTRALDEMGTLRRALAMAQGDLAAAAEREAKALATIAELEARRDGQAAAGQGSEEVRARLARAQFELAEVRDNLAKAEARLELSEEAKVRAEQHRAAGEAETSALKMKLAYADGNLKLLREELEQSEAAVAERNELLARRERLRGEERDREAEREREREREREVREREGELKKLEAEAKAEAAEARREAEAAKRERERADREAQDLGKRARELEETLALLRREQAAQAAQAAQPSAIPASVPSATGDAAERLLRRLTRVPSAVPLVPRVLAHLEALVSRIELSPAHASPILAAVDPTVNSPTRGGSSSRIDHTAGADLLRALTDQQRETRSFTDRALSMFRELRTVSSPGDERTDPAVAAASGRSPAEVAALADARNRRLVAILDEFQAMASQCVHGSGRDTPAASDDTAAVVGLVARLMQDAVKQRKRQHELLEAAASASSLSIMQATRALADRAAAAAGAAGTSALVSMATPGAGGATAATPGASALMQTGNPLLLLPMDVERRYRSIIDLIAECDTRYSECTVDRVLRAKPRHPGRSVVVADVREALNKSSAQMAEIGSDFFKQLGRILGGDSGRDSVVRGLSRLFSLLGDVRRQLNESFGDALLLAAERSEAKAAERQRERDAHDKEMRARVGLSHSNLNNSNVPAQGGYTPKTSGGGASVSFASTKRNMGVENIY